MAYTGKNYLDATGLAKYDKLIKTYIGTEDDKQISKLKLSLDGNTLLAWYDQDIDPSTASEASADFKISLGGGDLATMISALAAIVPATYDSTNKVYSITGLSTTASNTLVAAINEVDGHADTNASAIGTLGSLSTTDKSNLVAAINEVFSKIGTDITTAINGLDVNEFALASASNGVVTIKGIKEIDGKIAVGTDTTKDVTLAKVATTGDADDVEYTSGVSVGDALDTLNGDNTTAGSVAKAVKDGIDALDVTEFAVASESNDVVTIKGVKEVDGKIAVGTESANNITLGTAAKSNKATTAIVEESTDSNLVSAAQVAAFVKSEIAGLEGAMHFRGVITRQTGETDAQAIARVITNPKAGDVVVMSDNAKEYIYESSTIGWKEVGDETEFVKKTTTIAGVDLEDNITKTELLTALNVVDGAQVNVIETVKVNGSALTPDGNKAVDVTVAEGSTNGTVAVNGTDVAVHGLGSAAYTASTAYDAAGTAASAIAALDASIVNTATGSTDDYGNVPVAASISITEVDGVITAVGEADADPFGAAAGAYEAIGSISNATIEALFSSKGE